MPDDYTQLNAAGSQGDYMDESSITYGTSPTTRKRPRVVIGDEVAGQLADVSEMRLGVYDDRVTVLLTQILEELKRMRSGWSMWTNQSFDIALDDKNN